MWHLYFVTTRDGHIYTGISTDVERRFKEHREGMGAKYLRGKGPLTLVYAVEIGSRSRASRAESLIKKQSHTTKLGLINKSVHINDLIGDLS